MHRVSIRHITHLTDTMIDALVLDFCNLDLNIFNVGPLMSITKYNIILI